MAGADAVACRLVVKLHKTVSTVVTFTRCDLTESMINDAGEQPLEITAKEQRWLKDIIADAKAGNWQSAAADARQMMEDQVEY